MSETHAPGFLRVLSLAPQLALHQEVTGKLRTSGHDVILLVTISTDLEKSYVMLLTQDFSPFLVSSSGNFAPGGARHIQNARTKPLDFSCSIVIWQVLSSAGDSIEQTKPRQIASTD